MALTPSAFQPVNSSFVFWPRRYVVTFIHEPTFTPATYVLLSSTMQSWWRKSSVRPMLTAIMLPVPAPTVFTTCIGVSMSPSMKLLTPSMTPPTATAAAICVASPLRLALVSLTDTCVVMQAKGLSMSVAGS